MNVSLPLNLTALVGSPVEGGNAEAAVEAVLAPLIHKEDIRAKTISAAGKLLKGCRHCNWCVKSQTVERFCVVEDAMTAIFPALLWADAVLFATPVHLGRLSAQLACIMERMRALLYGKMHRGCLQDKIGIALSIAFYRDTGADTTLMQINHSMALLGMIPADRGAVLYTSLDGRGALVREKRHMALEDSFGMARAREMVERAIRVARWIKAGKEALGEKSDGQSLRK